MSLWIKVLISLFVLQSVQASECRLKTNNIISLSGPVSSYLELLEIQGNLRGISVFHPIDNYSGKRIPGGLYLSTKALKEFEGSIVFFDKSREFEKALKRFKNIQSIEVHSRGMTPKEVFLKVGDLLGDHLLDCELQKKVAYNKVIALEKSVKSKIKKIEKSLFFMGDISKKIPSTVISNDGFVYWLRKEKLIDSYPSHLEYLTWSMKILNPMMKSHYLFGIEDSINREKSFKKLEDKRYSVKYPGALTPGHTQLEFLDYLLNHF